MSDTEKSGVHRARGYISGDDSEGSKEFISSIWSFLMAWLQIIIQNVYLVLETDIYI